MSMPLSPKSFVALILAVCAGAFAAGASAQTATKPGQKLLTRDQLRACMAQEARIKTAVADVAKQQAEMEADKAEIGKRDAALKETTAAFSAKRAALDPANAEGLAALKGEAEQLKADADELDSRIAQYNTHLPEFNKKVEAVNADKAAYKTDCADRAYDEKDYFAIKRGK